jgi:hypothetical protein
VTPDALAPPFFLAAGLLVAAGFAKLARPRPTAQAMVDAGLPGSAPLARGVGGMEIVVGAWALVSGGSVAAWALASLYLGFASFLAYVLLAHPDAGSCGCAGATAVPPSGLHLVLNVLAAATAGGYATAGGDGAVRWLGGLGPAAIAVLGGLGLAAWLLVVVVTEVPAAFRAWAPGADEAPHEHPRGDRHAQADHALAAAGIGRGHASLWPGTGPPTGEGTP